MEPRSLEYIALSCDAQLCQAPPHKVVRSICTDSRQARAGDLFFALRGERFDGHFFLPEIAEKGVAAAVVEQDHPTLQQHPRPLPLLKVKNPRQALGQVATRYRQDFDLPTIAVGGSNGKTTTKDLIASVLQQRLKILASESSFNNDIGVPLTLFRLTRSTQAAVLEAGTNHPGELAPLIRMIQPRFSVLTSIDREHLEFFGDLAGVAEEESWLGKLLPPDGKLFVNGEARELARLLSNLQCQIVRIGRGKENHWRVRQIKMDDTGLKFQVEAPDPEFSGTYEVNLLGSHQAVNALFAIALGRELGLTRAEIQQGLVQCHPPKMRLQLSHLHGIRLLDDSYNANADSMRAALRTLRDYPCKGRRVGVLGDMAELGTTTESAHAEIGRYAAEMNIHELITVGPMARLIAQAARQAGLSLVHDFPDAEHAASALKKILHPGDVLLVKASRATKLERIGEILRGNGFDQ